MKPVRSTVWPTTSPGPSGMMMGGGFKRNGAGDYGDNPPRDYHSREFLNPNTRKPNQSKVCIILTAVILTLIVAGSIGVALFFWLRETNEAVTHVEYMGEMVLMETWDEQLRDKSSTQYQNKVKSIKTELDQVFKTGQLSNIYNKSEIKEFRPGSVLVDFRITLNIPSKNIRIQNGTVVITLDGQDTHDDLSDLLGVSIIQKIKLKINKQRVRVALNLKPSISKVPTIPISITSESQTTNSFTSATKPTMLNSRTSESTTTRFHDPTEDSTTHAQTRESASDWERVSIMTTPATRGTRSAPTFTTDSYDSTKVEEISKNWNTTMWPTAPASRHPATNAATNTEGIRSTTRPSTNSKKGSTLGETTVLLQTTKQTESVTQQIESTTASDEAVCGKDEIHCNDTRYCFSRGGKCDGDVHCPDGSDEMECVAMNGSRVSVFSDFMMVPLCAQSSTSSIDQNKLVAMAVCRYLGYKALESFWVNEKETVFEGGTFQVFLHLDLFTGDFSLAYNCQPLHVTCLSIDESCGNSNVALSSNYITYGSETVPGQWPWIVHVSRRGTMICAGSILHNDWIITAAHCVTDDDYEDTEYMVTVGSFLRRTAEDSEAEYDVIDITVHPNYTRSNGRGVNDLALLKLNSSISFTSFVQPVCLPRSESYEYNICYITGWGRNEEGGFDDKLQQVKVMTLGGKDCDSEWYDEVLTESTICATHADTFLSGFSPSCFGDSGGPMVCLNNVGRWELHGVVSFGPTDCYNPLDFFVFSAMANVNYYLPWIEGVTGL